MSAALVNLTLEQGATFYRVLYWRDEDDNPIPLNGYSARMQVRPTLDSDEVQLEASTDDGRITIDGALGKITIRIEAEDTAAVVFANGAHKRAGSVYQIEVESGAPDGFVTRLLEGRMTLSPEVTR
jgi:hypothetical protein